MARPFIVASGPDIAPYQVTDPNGQVSGILVDLYRECFRRMGLGLDYQVYPWSRAQEVVAAGEADGMTTVITDERLAYALPTTELIGVQRRVAFASRANPRFETVMKALRLDDLKGLTVLEYVGSGWAKENMRDWSVEFASTPDAVLRMLAVGRGDFFIEDRDTTLLRLAAIKREAPQIPFETIEPSPHALLTFEFRLMVSRKSEFSRDVGAIDTSLAAMRVDGTTGRIYAKFGIAAPS